MIMQSLKKTFIYGLLLALSFGITVSAVAADFATTKNLAERGDAEAQAILGVMYNIGEGVRQDYTQAIHWYQKSANQGNRYSQNNLGLMYKTGQGVRQDYAKAFDLFKKAANQDSPDSQFNLGIMYYKGEGVLQNKATAKEFFGKACDNGDQGGCDNYRNLN